MATKRWVATLRAIPREAHWLASGHLGLRECWQRARLVLFYVHEA